MKFYPYKVSHYSRGFALVITLSLMVLLALLAVGMLSLSGIAVRSISRGDAMIIAQGNARMALMMALADLQKQTGPDQRVTVTADQSAHGQPEQSAHWTGVFDSWAWDPSEQGGEINRPDPSFRQWLISGMPQNTSNKGFPAAVNGELVEMVSAGTLGADSPDRVVVPMMKLDTSHIPGNLAWWVGDEGMKARLDTPTAEQPLSAGKAHEALASARRVASEWAQDSLSNRKPFTALQPWAVEQDQALARVLDWNGTRLLGGEAANPNPLFHDLTTHGEGLLVNVRKGGFRRDMSMWLEQPLKKEFNQALYKIAGHEGVSWVELWQYYNLWQQLSRAGSFSYSTDGAGAGGAFLQSPPSVSSLESNDPSVLYRFPAFIESQTLFSLNATKFSQGPGQAPMLKLRLVMDPIITLWNPFDVVLKIDPAYLSAKFWALPYDLTIQQGIGASARTQTVSLHKLLMPVGAGTPNFLSLLIGKTDPLILRPGEVVVFSQGPDTPIQQSGPTKRFILDSAIGWNFGGGLAYPLIDNNGDEILCQSDEPIRYQLSPNNDQIVFFLAGNDFFYKETSTVHGESANLGGMLVDDQTGQGGGKNFRATDRPDVFPQLSEVVLDPGTLDDSKNKSPMMSFRYAVKTETSIHDGRKHRFLARYNPLNLYNDFRTLLPDELELSPCEIGVIPLTSLKTQFLEVTPSGHGYFGGGKTAEKGTSFLVTHSIPRTPPYSLASFQHAFANGIATSSWGRNDAYHGKSMANRTMMPRIMQAIGNSWAQAVIPSDKLSKSLATQKKPLADHSYLMNHFLWDDWFLSGIAPQTADTYSASERIEQRQLAEEFLSGNRSLPTIRYKSNQSSSKASDILQEWFSGSSPASDADQKTARYLRVEGMFNVNSTSVPAWTSVLGGLRAHPAVVRAAGDLQLRPTDDAAPVSRLQGPEDLVALNSQSSDPKDSAQWVGRRELNETEIRELAEALVREIRLRGPFLSLADFVNRRPGTDKHLALAGAIQSALNDPAVSLNAPYKTGDRSRNTGDFNSSNFDFPEAEVGPTAQGAPGVVNQADILTPLAPWLSVRSDSFLIRAYGDCTDVSGKVLAQAWCEAVVVREPDFVDPSNSPTTEISLLSDINKKFGRRYQIRSFRWLTKEEV